MLFKLENTHQSFIKMARTQKNKATAHHLGMLKAKLAKYKRELLIPKGGGGGGGEGFDVSKTGDARIGLIGKPRSQEFVNSNSNIVSRISICW